MERTFTLLSRACPEMPAASLASLTVGESEAALLRLRVCTLGERLQTIDSCPACATMVELAIDAAALPPMTGRADPGPSARSITLEEGGWRIRFRLPTIGDLALLARDGGAAAGARRRLLELCVEEAHDAGGAPVPAAALPAELEARVAAVMDQEDPAAQMTTSLTCPACGHLWQATLDVASFFWQELAAVAKRLLREVHELASRYGWSEADILRLSAARRHAYLEEAWA